MTTNPQRTLLVTGASGKLGRRVIELLLDATGGTDRVIATTRTPEKLADVAAHGVEVRNANFDQPESLAAAFAGADRLLLISTDALGVPGLRLAQHRDAVDAAAKAGVQHVVYTSFTRPEPGSPITFAGDHYGTEQALAGSTLAWTILRNNIYADGLLMSLPPAMATGALVAAVGAGGVGYVTREDCARAAAAALAAHTTGRATLDITGPEIVTYDELAALASELSGRPVRFVDATAEERINGLIAAGFPPPVAATFASFEAATAKGLFAVVSDAVLILTGTPPQGVRDFLTAHKAALLTSRGPGLAPSRQ